MGVREWANQNSALTTVAAVLVLIFALGYSICQLAPGSKSQPIKAVYFYDLTNGTLFTADPKEMAPIDVPSGEKIKHRNKEMKAGFRAYVFSCDGCPSDMSGMNETDIEAAGANLAYIDRYTDEALEMYEKYQNEAGGEGGVPRMPGPMGMFEMGRLIAKAPSKPGTYPKLYGHMEPAGANLARDALQKCADGSYPKQCIPGR